MKGKNQIKPYKFLTKSYSICEKSIINGLKIEFINFQFTLDLNLEY